MSQHWISANKVRRLIVLWSSTIVNKSQLADCLRISRGTARKYIVAFERSALTGNDIERLSDAELLVALLQRSSPRTELTRSDRYNALAIQLESIHTRLKAAPLSLIDVWSEYAATAPTPYKYSQFVNRYNLWCEERNLKSAALNTRLSIVVNNNDLQILRKWKLSNNRQLWERAVAILAMSNGDNVASICRKIERSPQTIKRWCQIYAAGGFDQLSLPRTKAQSTKSLDDLKAKKDRLIKLIHESPRLHDINRASWSLSALATVYERLYGASISKSSISEYFQAAGYKFKKAKKVLTSSDPEYREKLSKITQILSELTPNEKFFSIDEFGPFSVRGRGGVALVPGDEIRTIPQRQKSKGSLICTAALELSTNQVTHFYSSQKNTREMIKLLTILIQKYKCELKIYFSWDTASWHASKALYEKVEEVNSEKYRSNNMTPLVELVPLPTGAQFLNVIESVFSGMSKAILHNSDYQSVDECTMAIDRYFYVRNIAFTANPRRAGKKIWGKERTEAVFKEENNCKDPNWR
jgi:transposase